MHEVIDLSEETDESVNGQRMTSVDSDYDLYQSSPKPGDLVFATLDGIKHATRRSEHFSRTYIIMDAVVGFTRIDIGGMRAWKSGLPFEKYVKREKLVID